MRSLVVAVALLAGAGACGPPERPIAEGDWIGELDLGGATLPFRFRVERTGEDGALRITVRNGEERIVQERVRIADRALSWPLDPFDSTIAATLAPDGRSLTGRWTKPRRHGEVAIVPFAAHTAAEPAASPAPAIAGRWRVAFASEEAPAVGVFRDGSDGAILGTFETVTGDYRWLEGRSDDDRSFHLAAFDGAHAFLFEAKTLPDGSLAGTFRSGNWFVDTWTATRDDDAALPDGFGLTTVAEGADLAALRYPDLAGVRRSPLDPSFGAGPRIVYAFGSWCPNCNDATTLLRELRSVHPELRVVGLAFELSGDPAEDAVRVRDYVARRGIDWPVLIAGSSDKDDASAALPVVDRVRAFPTFLFVDGDGAVRAVYSGFSGPATGDAHRRLRAAFESTVARLGAGG